MSKSFHKRLEAFGFSCITGCTLVDGTIVVNDTVENFFLKIDFLEGLRRSFNFKVVLL